ncbi:MAG: alginate lyase family protein [Rhizobacter sp.]|nr:alginate lyase family protein [Ferruginibacter sp.]
MKPVKKILFLFFVSSFMACSVSKAYMQNNEPAVFALDATTLENNKRRINANDPELSASYKLLLKDADKALLWGPVSVTEKKNVPPSGDKHDYMSLAPYHWPNPATKDGLPYVRKDGQTNPEVKEYKDKEYMPKLCGEVHTLALAYYFSGERKYADHAAKLMQVWFLDTATRMNPNLNYGQAIKGQNTGRGAGMIDSRHFVKLVDAIGLLKGSKSWTTKHQQGMKDWFTAFLNWMQTSKIGTDEMNADNNHGAWYDAQRLSMALFISDKTLANKIVLNAAGRLDKQLDANGYFPKELERTISLHYTSFVMEAFFNIAQMATRTDEDLWNRVTPSGASLKKAFETAYPFFIKEKEWQYPQIKPYEYEQAFFLLQNAAIQFNCRNCKEKMTALAGEKANRLRANLLYP